MGRTVAAANETAKFQYEKCKQMTVEKAGIEDIDTLVKLRLAYLREDRGGLSDHETVMIQKSLPGYFHKHLGKDLFVYIIRDEKNIISCAFLLIIEKPVSPAFLNGMTGTVLNVYTHPSYRRQGHAAEIMKTMLSDAKEKNLSVIELKSTEDGYSLYRSVGFAEDHSGYYFMKWNNQ